MKLTEVLANIDKGVFIISSNSTLSRWLREWLVDYALPTVKQSTYVSYEAYARLHVEPALGRIKLSDLTVEQFQRFFNKKHNATGTEKGLSEKSLRNLYNMLHNCLEQAVINGHLMRNPINGVKLPTVPKERKTDPFPNRTNRIARGGKSIQNIDCFCNHFHLEHRCATW